MVTVVYPGASPEDVESLVTSKVENELTELEGYDYSNSFSRNSVSVSIVRLVYGTNTEEAWRLLRQKMEDVQRELPSECDTIDVNTDLVETAGIIVSVSGENYSYEELFDYAEELKNDLSEISGVSRFDIDGKQEKNVLVEVDYKKLNQFNLSLYDITRLLESQNLEIPSGSLDTGTTQINVKATGTFNSINEIKDVIIGISSENGSIVKLSNIADVKIGLGDSTFKIKEGKKKCSSTNWILSEEQECSTRWT